MAMAIVQLLLFLSFFFFSVRVKQDDGVLTHVLYVSESVIGKVPSKAIAMSLSKDLNSTPEQVKLFISKDQGKILSFYH